VSAPAWVGQAKIAKLHPLDWLALGLLGAGLTFVASGLLPAEEAQATVERILPLLLFLGTVVILAELTAEAEVFDVIAARLALTARGSYFGLFLLSVAFAAITTIVLNLDTTAILLTPVMLALARKLKVNPLPLAMTTVWLANTASLLLPVSNLTNLLAANRVGLEPLAFAERLFLPQIAAIAVTMLFLWHFAWRGAGSLGLLAPHEPKDQVLFRLALMACGLFVVSVLAGLELGAASAVAATILVIAFLARHRSALRWSLLPWRLLVLVTGMFLVVQTVGRLGLEQLASGLIGTDPGAEGAFRAAATGALFANLVNNLPSYVAGEAVVPAGNQLQLLALLIGTNVGPLATPWASLATLLWYERCRAAGVMVPMRRFLLTGAGLAVAATSASVVALILSS
jgi:arsenical pump membrane protein